MAERNLDKQIDADKSAIFESVRLCREMYDNRGSFRQAKVL